MTEQHSLCGGATPCLFMHLPMDLWVRLYFLAVTNRAAMNAGVQVLFFSFLPSIILIIYVEVEFLNYTVTPRLAFPGNTKPFSPVGWTILRPH